MRIFEGKVVSLSMKNTVAVEVLHLRPHPLYKRRLRKDRKILVDTRGFSVALGDRVKIAETRPISKNKHFKIVEVLKNGSK